jgi:hypothetical protein
MSDGLRERDQLELGGRGLVLLGLLGSTAASRTWLAADAGDALHVARRLSGRDPAQRAALLGATSGLSRLDHPGLLAPEPAWEEGGSVWVVRLHDPGVSLRRLAAVARLEPRHLASIGDDVLDGLTALHAAGATHGVLHPGNILVGLDGRARVVDAGLGVDATTAVVGSRGRRQRRGGRDVRDDIEAVAAALRIAMTPPHRRGQPASDTHRRSEEMETLDAILGGPSPAFGGAISADAARAALCQVAGDPDARIRREISALVNPLRAVRPLATPALTTTPRPAGGSRPPQLPEPAPAPAPPAPTRATRSAARRVDEPAAPGASSAPAEAGSIPAGAAIRLRPVGKPAVAGVRVVRGRALALARLLRRGAVTGLRRLRRRAAPPSLPAGREPAGWRPATGRRLGLWLAPLVAAALVAGVVVMLSGSRTGAPVAVTPPPLSAAPAPARTAAPSATPPPATVSPVPSPAAASPSPSPPAPPAAGPIVGLSLSPQGGGGCTVTAGGSCEVQVNVDLDPQPGQTTISFDLLLVDQCTGASATVAGGSVVAGSGFDFVWADAPVVFPSGDPTTVYAVTSSPAEAASPGLAISGSGPAC